MSLELIKVVLSVASSVSGLDINYQIVKNKQVKLDRTALTIHWKNTRWWQMYSTCLPTKFKQMNRNIPEKFFLFSKSTNFTHPLGRNMVQMWNYKFFCVISFTTKALENWKVIPNNFSIYCWPSGIFTSDLGTPWNLLAPIFKLTANFQDCGQTFSTFLFFLSFLLFFVFSSICLFHEFQSAHPNILSKK